MLISLSRGAKSAMKASIGSRTSRSYRDRFSSNHSRRLFFRSSSRKRNNSRTEGCLLHSNASGCPQVRAIPCAIAAFLTPQVLWNGTRRGCQEGARPYIRFDSVDLERPLSFRFEILSAIPAASNRPPSISSQSFYRWRFVRPERMTNRYGESTSGGSLCGTPFWVLDVLCGKGP